MQRDFVGGKEGRDVWWVERSDTHHGRHGCALSQKLISMPQEDVEKLMPEFAPGIQKEKSKNAVKQSLKRSSGR